MSDPRSTEAVPAAKTITKISVSGFKSLRETQTVELRPLTILAGKNSAGKSSLMQPLLLLKQSIESPLDPPGGILLNGPIVKFTSANQVLSQDPIVPANTFQVGIDDVNLQYKRIEEHRIGIDSMDDPDGKMAIRAGMTSEEFYPMICDIAERFYKDPEVRKHLPSGFMRPPAKQDIPNIRVHRDRCFLALYEDQQRLTRNSIERRPKNFMYYPIVSSQSKDGEVASMFKLYMCGYLDSVNERLLQSLLNIIHLPGLRGNPERQYPLTSFGETFPGRFDQYAPNIILGWQERAQLDLLKSAETDLASLDLANHVRAHAKEGTAVEVQVKPGDSGSAILSLADVGLGVSQCLPVVVALHVAEPHQLLHIEQPEIHLHPRAQAGLASVLARAVRRGVRMVVETHSDHLLLGIQTLVAQGILSANEVQLLWFEHNDKARTSRIHPAILDDAGGFGAWPEDFSEIEMESRANYLDAVAKRKRGT